MNLLGVQLTTIPFAAFMVYVAFIHFKKGYIIRETFKLWLILWGAFITIAIFPQILNPIVIKFHFLRTLDLVMVIAFMILSVFSYNNYIQSRRTMKQIDELIKKMTKVSDPNRKRDGKTT